MFVNTLVADVVVAILDTRRMRAEKPKTYLREVLDLVGMKQAELARQLETSRQQVSKWTVEGRRISPIWAKRIDPILGIDWTYLVEGKLPPALQPGNDQGKLINKQLLFLKDAWDILNVDERAAIVAAVDALTAPRRKSV